MKKLILSLIAVVAVSIPCAHGEGIFGTGVEINTVLYANNNGGMMRLLPDGSTATLDQTSFGTSPETTPLFNLGSFPADGTLALKGFSVLTYNDSNTVVSATANYRIFLSGTNPNSAAFTAVPLTLKQNAGGNAGDMRFSLESLNTNLLNGLAPGTYTVGIYYNANFATGGPSYDNNGGANYGATFTVTAVPEPGTWALLLLGAGVLIEAQRRRSTQS